MVTSDEWETWVGRINNRMRSEASTVKGTIMDDKDNGFWMNVSVAYLHMFCTPYLHMFCTPYLHMLCTPYT